MDQELLLRNEYLVTENHLLRQQIKGRVQLSEGEGKALAEIGKKLGKKALKDEALSRLILFGKGSLRYALKHYDAHDHEERPHQGKGHVVLMPAANHGEWCDGPIRCWERLGGLLKHYYRAVA